MKEDVYKNYLSNIYADSDRITAVDQEYANLFFWNKKYIFPLLSNQKDGEVLDIGCGLGQNLYSFRRLGYKKVIGIDVSLECVEFCKSKKFDVLQISAEEFLKDKENFFNIITIYHLVEHIKKDQIVGFLRILHSALKPGGSLIIDMPNGNNAVSSSHDRYVDISHEILYTPKSLRQILIMAGFTPANIVIKELVAYSPNDKNIFKKIIKKTLLPVLTVLVDLIWFLFFIAQGTRPQKNRPVLVSISRK